MSPGKVLARQEFIAPENAFSPSEINRYIAEFDTFDEAVHDLPDAVLIFLELPLALSFPDALDNDLLGRLRRNAPKLAKP